MSKRVEECVMDVSVAMYGHAKVKGMGLKGIWKMGTWCGVEREMGMI